MFKKTIIAASLLFSLTLPTIINAQISTAVPFLLIAPDSRAGGMGETGGGLADNGAAIFWNPAGLAFLRGSEIQITHSNWLPQFHLDLFYDYATYRTYLDDLDGAIFASITYMNFGEFVRTGEGSPEPIGTFRSFDAAATIGYATTLGKDWGLGFNFRVIHSRLSEKPTGQEQGTGVATTVSFDLATMYRPEALDNRFSVGLNISNMGPKIYYIDQEQADPLPTNMRLGFAGRLWEDDFNSLTLTADFTKLLVTKRDSTTDSDPFYEALFTSWTDDGSFKEELKQIVSSFGMEYWYGQPGDFMFAARAGYFYEDPHYGNRKFVTFGASIRYDIYQFDFSYLSTTLAGGDENHPLGETLRFTVAFKWGEQNETVRGFPKGI